MGNTGEIGGDGDLSGAEKNGREATMAARHSGETATALKLVAALGRDSCELFGEAEIF